MITADSFFTIGKTHMVCEDYALSGTLERGDLDDLPFITMAVVADGCSSSTQSDWGARFLCQSAIQVISNLSYTIDEDGEIVLEDLGDKGQAIIERAEAMRRTADVSTLANDATLLVVYWAWGSPIIKVRTWGDGVVAARNRHSQEIEFFLIEYGSNAPGYLSYTINPGRKSVYLEATGGEHTVMGYELDSDQASAFHYEQYEGLEATTFDFPVADYDIVAVLTDGVSSFHKADHTPTSKKFSVVPTRDVLSQILDIRNHSKGFVTRRVRNGFLHRFCVQEHWSHIDDLGVGMIYVPDDAVPTEEG